MAAKAKELSLSGKKVFDFSVGEPDFTTPQHICDAAIAAMRAGHTHYTAASGIIELKQAIAPLTPTARSALTRRTRSCLQRREAFSAQRFYGACNPGDEVVIPAPYWVSYAELVKLTGAKPVIVETREADHFKLTPAQLRKALTPRTDDFVPLLAEQSDRQRLFAGGVGGAGRYRAGDGSFWS